MKFIIEHMDPEVFEWCEIEYEHISEFVGKENLIFTNIKDSNDQKKLAKLGKVYKESIHELKWEKCCILDPASNKLLEPADTKKFDYIILGGVLGDDPPRERTKQELSSRLPYETRNLEKMQMSTDTAAYVAKLILFDAKRFNQIRFQDEIEIELGEGESNILPYRYVIENNKPVLPKRLIAYLRKRPFF